MKRIFFSTFVVLFTLMLVLPSCSRKIIDFTIVSTRNINLNKMDTFVRDAGRTDGYDIKHIVIFTPLGQLDIKLAVDRAIDAVPGCIALVDCLVYTQGFWAIVYGQTTLIAEGTPIIDPSLLVDENAALYKDSDYLMVKLNRKGEVEKLEAITKETFLKHKSRVVKSKNVTIQKKDFKTS